MLTGLLGRLRRKRGRRQLRRPDLPCGTGRDAEAAPAPDRLPQPIRGDVHRGAEIGPSQIVKGYWEGDIEAAFEGYKEAFDGTDYSVTKEEREEVDAEVNFSGQGVAGQVKLLEACKDRTDVSITIRPS